MPAPFGSVDWRRIRTRYPGWYCGGEAAVDPVVHPEARLVLDEHIAAPPLSRCSPADLVFTAFVNARLME